MKAFEQDLSLEQLKQELIQEAPKRWRMDSMALPNYVSAVALLDIAESLRVLAERHIIEKM